MRFFILLLLCLSPFALAKQKGEPVQSAPPQQGASIGNDWLRVSINTDEQRILRDWQQRCLRENPAVKKC
jgi:hypothetical protein